MEPKPKHAPECGAALGGGEAAPPPAAAAMPGGADTGTAAKQEGWGVTHRTPQTTGMGAVPNLAHRLLRAKNWI